ncbi:MAG: flagellar biosynthetic protein FliO [Bdellovibrionales bacterium]|nr:flagellar biosynthetic protein FliO [Bdellovibrionales bacterium]
MKWIIFFVLFSQTLNAKVDIKNITLKKGKQFATLTVNFNGLIENDPKIMLKDSIVQIEIPNGIVWPKIEKKTTLGEKSFDTTLMGYQYDKEIARVRAVLPYKIEGKEDSVEMDIKKNQILLHFPLSEKKKNVTENNYDEKLLNDLLADKKVKKEKNEKTFLPTEDQIKTVLSGNEDFLKSEKKDSGFSIGAYSLKFAVFLLLVLGIFFGIANIFKKKVLKKGKLGFLNKTNLLEVLNTTYIAPKKNLMVVRAHNQVFLIGTSEKGIHFLSEVKDMNGLLKNGEQELSGFNFDNKLGDAFNQEKEFQLKTEPSQSAKEQPVEKVAFSDQIKNKLKELKPLN